MQLSTTPTAPITILPLPRPMPTQPPVSILPMPLPIPTQPPVTILPVPGPTTTPLPPVSSAGTVRIGFGRDTPGYATRELLFNPLAKPIATFGTSITEAIRGARHLLGQIKTIPGERFALALINDAKAGAWVARRVDGDQLLMRGIDGGPGIQSFSFERAMPGLGAIVTNLGTRQVPNTKPTPPPAG